MNIRKEDIDWKLVRYLKEPLGATDEEATWKYKFWLNEPLASWDVFSYWEAERIKSMEKHLVQGDILFDIGTEQGWCNLAYAQMVGPENMVLIEPTQEFWPNIKALWEKNFDKKPKAFCNSFFSDKNTIKQTITPDYSRDWPSVSNGDLIDKNKYQYIHNNTDKIGEIKIDTWVKVTKIVPTALTMDTEGSELLILKGAEQTLKDHDLKVWVSIHDDLGLRDYGVKDTDTIAYLESLGYKGEFLAKDHEQHWYFRK